MANLSIQEIKTIIRGLLISTPEEVTVLKLRRDFKAQEGQDIPFYGFGFHDVTSFLRSMPDVCQITSNANGPYAIVRVVESDKSAHVSSLVLRQKTTVKGRRRRSNLSARGRSSRLLYKPKTQNYHLKELHNEPTSFQLTQNGCIESPDIQIPCYEVKTTNTIKRFESPQYDPGNTFCESFTKDEDKQLPNNKECAVHQENHLYVPNTSGNEFADLQTFFDFHLRQILVDDEGLPIREIQEYLQNELSSSYGIVTPNDVEPVLRRIPYICIEDDYVYNTMYETPSHEEKFLEESKNDVKSEICPNEIDGGLDNEDVNSSEKIALSATANTFVPSSSSEKIQRLERNLNSLMKDNINGILGSELKEKYKMKFAAPLIFQAFGFDTTEDLVSSMPHIFNYIALENGDCKLYPCTSVPGQKLEEKPPEFIRSYDESVVPLITRRNVQWMMNGYPNGLHLNDFERIYKDTFLTNIELKQMGLSSVEEFVKCLEEVDILKIYILGSDTWLFPIANFGKMLVNNEPLPAQEVTKNENDIKILKEKFPLDVVGPDAHVKQVEIPKWMEKSSLIEIFVQEVNNPHNFWITFCGEQYSRALDSLMDDLQAFYCSKSHSYRMPPEFIREGQDCVTQYVDEWHRARVTSIISATEIEVWFYDYGTKRVVPKNDIHYLHNAHSALPAQAMSAVLANVAPLGGKWTQEASKRFLQLIANKALIGIVVSADKINNMFSLFLCDTSDDNNDIYIHEVLISEGYAVEVGLDKKETGPQNETNIIETLDQETKFALEEEEEEEEEDEEEEEEQVQSYVTSREIGAKVEKGQRISINDNISQEDMIACSGVLELQSRNSSRKTSQSSLPYAVEMNCLQSVSTPISLGAVDSVSTVCDSSVTKIVNDSGELHRKIAPPPGFSHISKCDAEPGFSVGADSHVLCSQNKQCDDIIEISKTQTENVSNNLKECDNRESPPETTFQKMDCHQPVKGVSSGVNANFPQDVKSSYLQNSYSYPNWTPPPPTYSNFPAFPASSFPPVNALAPLSVSPFPIPSMPNPLEYCNMWYYEQCRQQAFFQGILAHQQMANATFSPFHPGMFLPPSYTSLSSQLSSQNQMNISEVHSPEPSPAAKANSRGSSPALYSDGITTATQTEVRSLNEKGDEKLKISRNRSSELFPSERIAQCTVVADSSAKENEYSVHLHDQSKNDSHRCSEPVQIVEDTCHLPLSPITSFATVGEEVTVNDIAEGSFHDSPVLTNEGQNLNSGKSDLKVHISNKSSENLILNQPFISTGFNKTTVICDYVSSHSSTNLDDSQGKIEKDNVSNPFRPISADDSQIKLYNRTLIEVPDHEVQYQDKPIGSELCSSQNVLCSAKPEETGTVLHCGIRDPHHFEGGRKEQNNVVRISQLDVANHSVVKSGCEEFEEQELAQLLPIDSLSEQEINLNVDDLHEQEMIDTAQDELMKTSFEKFESLRNTTAKLLAREGNDSIREKISDIKANNEFSNGVQSSVHKTKSLGSVEKFQCERNEEGGNGDGMAEITTDCLLRQENQLVEPQCSIRHSSVYNESCSDTSEKPSSTLQGLCTEFGALSFSNQQKDISHSRLLVQQYGANREKLYMNSQESEIKSKIRSEEKSKVPKSPIKRVRPVLGAKLSNEVSASFTSGPSQPAMTQKAPLSTPIGDSLLTKDSGSFITQPLSQAVSWKTTWNLEEISRSGLQGQMGPDCVKNRNSSKQTTLNRHRDGHTSAKQGATFQFVKMIFLCGKPVHQINLDGRPYVFTDEVVSHFTPFNGRHVILKILEARKVEINFLELSRRRRPEFFECLDKSDITCLSRGPTGNVIGSVHIVPLRSVPYMLRALNRDDDNVAADVKEEMEKFDPSDPYWSGCFD